jgi:PadR family transcriptional regulator AphA
MLADGVILGLISLMPSSGYVIKNELEKGEAGMFSALSYGSIYPRLRALEHEGLIETREERTGERTRKVHELTAKGWEALAAWLAEPSAYPIPMRDELLLKMEFWNAARPEDRAGLARQLRQRREQTRELLDYSIAWPTNGFSYIDELGMLMLDYGRIRLEGELAWLERAIAQIEGPPRPPVQDPRGMAAEQQERRRRALEQARSQSTDR